ncbi:hypothetical protein ACFQ9X_45470 [Catenulispora yoronensis]
MAAGCACGEQVLVCPQCQSGRDWTADLAHCAECGSARLVRMLGSTQCKDCGAEDSVRPEQAPADPGTTPDAPATPAGSAAASLSDDVRAALERHFRDRND